MTDLSQHAQQAATYIGDELELFEKATCWKAYFASHLKKFIRGDVAEVGAGLGTTTRSLCNAGEASWTCIEPDAAMCDTIRLRVQAGELPAHVSVLNGALSSLENGRRFDTILYIDVLEHIENDRVELQTAVDRLKPGGFVIVLAPAHQFLFTPFDEAVGHFRRYSRNSLLALKPERASIEKAFYLDSVGIAASALNKLLLRQSAPTVSQILLWDRFLVPCSRIVDPLVFHRLGKTVIAIWRAA